MSDTWWIDKEALLQEQLDVLSLDLDKDLFISGPPGSGKTNLLLLRANHLVITQPDAEFFIVCFTRLLTRFIRTGAGIYEFPENRIVTKQALYENILADQGRLPSAIKELGRAERAQRVMQAMCEMMNAGVGRTSFPLLFIDEAQDYSSTDLEIFRYLSQNIACAADARQGLYEEGESGYAWLKNYEWDYAIRLVHHYRTAPNLIEVSDKIMEGKLGHIPMLPTHQYVGDITPIEVFDEVSLNQQIEILIPKILRQIDIYPNQNIGIIVPRRDDLSVIWQALASNSSLLGKITNAMEQDFDSSKPVWVATMHSAKGLEFRCVHIMAADTIKRFNAHARRLAFTGVTRAKTALSIYHESPLLPFFSAALAKKETEKISVDRLFGKKK
ncbi:ATP-binding domain-containing protein [Achromobacter xylosoxidans]|uniref:ATP-binding domain-containing protein n=1 Tax=Alcaligenes xylosoxydans xylosoxydans TaxID=85698 RepID=UPI0006C3E1AF|nr:ATP-binding domain-containing protein [Achromobacter xylosoxidans]CUJ53575.1 Helicase IV [Achromobacter xylosoxidans]